MSSNSHEKATRDWVQIRKKLFLQTKAEVYKLLADSQSEFKELENQYDKELRGPWKVAPRKELDEALLSADVIFLGDFHALQQSQRSHLRILRDWPKQGTRTLVLAVEFFQARHQALIDRFMKGKISEKTFLQKISWSKSWGFPWEHYAPLIRWARDHQIPVYGINWGLRQKSMRSIKQRERFSAMALQKIKKKHPQAQIVTIYGDLHLSSRQLPKAVRLQKPFKEANFLRIFQNYEPLYFSLLRKGLESHVDLIRFKNGDFCLQSVPPWVKWQSYHLFLEQTFDSQIDASEREFDLTDHVAKLVRFLAAEFHFRISSQGLAVYTAEDSYVYERMKKNMTASEWTAVRYQLLRERSFYVPSLQVGYLGQVTVNHGASLAGEYVHALTCKRKSLYLQGIQDFERQIWIGALSYFGSKIINHRRKTSSVSDLRKALLLGGIKPEAKKALLLALHQKVREISFATTEHRARLLKSRYDNETVLGASKLLGAMLGERLYTVYRAGRWSTEGVREAFRHDLSGDDFIDYYYRQVRFFFQINAS